MAIMRTKFSFLCKFVLILITGFRSLNGQRVLQRFRRQWSLPQVNSISGSCRRFISVTSTSVTLTSSSVGQGTSCSSVIATYRAENNGVLLIQCPSFSVSCSGGGKFTLRSEGSATSVQKCGQSPFIPFNSGGNTLIVTYGSTANMFTNKYSFNFQCTVQTRGATEPDTTVPPPATNCDCGRQLIGQPRIIGGTDASDGELPWQALLAKTDPSTIYCGGTLLSNTWVLSAAHCGSKSGYVAILGEITRSDTSGNEATRTILEVINHERYVVVTSENDIALLKIESVSFNEFIQPACLPYLLTSKNFTGNDALVSGWGDTDPLITSTSDILQKVTLSIMSNYACMQNYGLLINDGSLCTQPDSSRDSCSGDSGGPLVWTDTVRYYLLGVVSFGVQCASSTYGGVYARTTYYLDWINTNAGQTFCNPIG